MADLTARGETLAAELAFTLAEIHAEARAVTPDIRPGITPTLLTIKQAAEGVDGRRDLTRARRAGDPFHASVDEAFTQAVAALRRIASPYHGHRLKHRPLGDGFCGSIPPSRLHWATSPPVSFVAAGDRTESAAALGPVGASVGNWTLPVSAGRQCVAPRWNKIASAGDHPDRRTQQEIAMTINEDSTNQTVTTTDDVEGHRWVANYLTDGATSDTDDVEGHRNVLEQVADGATSDTDDVEGHRIYMVTDGATSDTDDDVEGHVHLQQ